MMSTSHISYVLVLCSKTSVLVQLDVSPWTIYAIELRWPMVIWFNPLNFYFWPSGYLYSEINCWQTKFILCASAADNLMLPAVSTGWVFLIDVYREEIYRRYIFHLRKTSCVASLCSLIGIWLLDPNPFDARLNFEDNQEILQKAFFKSSTRQIQGFWWFDSFELSH